MRAIWIGLATLCISLCLISPIKAQWWKDAPPPVIHGQQMPDEWWEAAKRGAMKHNSNPFDVAAVMWMEMGGWREGPAGTGRNSSKYIGPCGFNKKCKIPKRIIYTPELQIEWAVKLLKGNLRKRLKSYNKEWYKNNYIRDVERLSRKLKSEAKHDLSEGCVLQ